MKIQSCYIAGFGKFAEQKFDFTSPLTIVRGDNGWGKTTLADFLRCMLYGLDGGRVKSVENNDRARYTPWRGGAFGGALVFEYGGKRYRVERSFGKTPAYDTARVFDQNQMQCFDFGEKAERLGETLFGMNSESYKKSVYVPQGEIETGSMPDDIKSRLLALLSTGGKGETTAERALEKLDAADKALRARRRPAKGKLDEIDERLREIRALKSEGETDLQTATGLRKSVAGIENELTECKRRSEQYGAQLERAARQSELATKRRAYEEKQTALQEAERELARLREFFGEITPQTVNTEGISTAVGEFYKKKSQLTEAEEYVAKTQSQYEKKKSLEEQADTCRRMLSVAQGDGRARAAKGKKKRPKKGKYDVLIIIVSLIVAALGAVLVDVQLYLGLGVLGVGVIGMLIMFFRLLPRREKTAESKLSKEALQGAENVRAELAGLESRLAEFPSDLEERHAAYQRQIEDLRVNASAMESGIRKFLGNFRFQEIYDYRSAVAQIRERIAAYDKAERAAAEHQESLAALGKDLEGATESAKYVDVESVKAQAAACERRKNELLTQRATAIAEAENLERKAAFGELNAEEERLTEEKTRLEKRHRAILYAKEFLSRAKENIAARYLQPVESGCRKYLSFLNGEEGRETLRFAADGKLFCEDGGSLRELGYYSTGMQELIGLCTRFALVDATFIKETPVLILDDPLVNLDDKRTEKARRLIKELSKRYQIVYFTCKKERVI